MRSVRLLACLCLFSLLGCAARQSHVASAADGTRGRESAADARVRVSWPPLDEAKWERVPGREHDAAMIVAVDDYTHLDDIPGVRGNATAWKAFFSRALGIPNSRITMKSSDDPLTITNALRQDVTSLGPDGRMWFVFIGHGSTSGTDGLLLTADSRHGENSQLNNSLKRAELYSVLQRAPGGAVMLLDACYSGKLQGGTDLLEGKQAARPAAKAPPSGVVVMTAATGDQTAGSLPDGHRPAFSYLLLGAMQGWGERDPDGSVTANSARAYVQEKLAYLLQGEKGQTPTLEPSNERLVLALGGNVDEPPMELVDPTPKAPPPETTRIDVPDPTPHPAPDADPSGWRGASRTLRSVGSSTLIAGAAGALIGVALWGSAKGNEDELKQGCPNRVNCDPSLRDKYDEANNSIKWGNVLTLGGAGVAVTGALLWAVGALLKPRGIDHESMSLTYVPGGAVLQMRGSL